MNNNRGFEDAPSLVRGARRRVLFTRVRNLFRWTGNVRCGPSAGKVRNVDDMNPLSARNSLIHASNGSNSSLNSGGSCKKGNLKKKTQRSSWAFSVNCRRRQRPPSLRRLIELGEWALAEERLCTSFGRKEAKAANEFGRMALHIACLRGAPPSLVSALLEANPDATSTMDKLGKLPIHCACVMMGGSVARNINGTATGSSAVGVAVGGGWAHGADCGGQVMDVLLKADPSSARRRDRRKDLPLHILASSCSISSGETGSALLKATEAVLNSYPQAAYKRDRNGNLPLHLACRLEDNADDDNQGPLHPGIERHNRFRRNNSNRRTEELHNRFMSTYQQNTGANVSVQLVRLILEANPAAVRVRGRGGLLPIHFVASSSAAASDEDNHPDLRRRGSAPAAVGNSSTRNNNGLPLSGAWASAAQHWLTGSSRSRNNFIRAVTDVPPVVAIARTLLDVYPEGAQMPDPRNGRTWSRRFVPPTRSTR